MHKIVLGNNATLGEPQNQENQEVLLEQYFTRSMSESNVTLAMLTLNADTMNQKPFYW